MPNGSGREEEAHADRLRELFARNQRMRQDALAKESESRELRPYQDSEAEITVTKSGIQGAARGVPRTALGASIVILALAALVWVVAKLAR